jgi:hypothetical protein
VVLAPQLWLMPGRSIRQQTVTMRTNVFECQKTSARISQKQRTAEKLEGQKIAIFRKLRLSRNEMPCRQEELLKFQIMLPLSAIVLGTQQIPQNMLVNKHRDPPLRETAEAKAHLRPPANTRLKAGLIHHKPALITLVGPADENQCFQHCVLTIVNLISLDSISSCPPRPVAPP